MAFSITIKGLDEFRKGPDDLVKKQFPFAMKNALNKTAMEAKAEVYRQVSARSVRKGE